MRTAIAMATAFLGFVSNEASALTVYDLADKTLTYGPSGSVKADTVDGKLKFGIDFYNEFTNSTLEITELNSVYSGSETDFSVDYTFDERPIGYDIYGSFHLDAYVGAKPDRLYNGGYTFLYNLYPNFGFSGSVNLVTTTAVPEPSTYALMLAGLGVLGAVVWRKRSL